MKRVILGLLLAFIAVLVVPVLLVQLDDAEPRRFEWVALEDTDFQDVSFQNTRQGLKLSGLLFVPQGEGPFPAAVIIHGSGTSRRDNGWYLTLVKYLQDHGVLVLLPDKRGSEQSDGNWRTASFQDLATDTVAAIGFLKDQDRIAVSEIGIIGLSQGGHIAPLVADLVHGDVDFVVNVSGGALPMHEMLVYEETHNIRELGVLPGLSDAFAYPAAWSIICCRQKAFWDAIGNFDPRAYWQKISVRALVLYGENDTNVPAGKSAEVLRSLGNPNIEVRLYEGSGHALESPPGEGDSIFRTDALEAIRALITRERPTGSHGEKGTGESERGTGGIKPA